MYHVVKAVAGKTGFILHYLMVEGSFTPSINNAFVFRHSGAADLAAAKHNGQVISANFLQHVSDNEVEIGDDSHNVMNDDLHSYANNNALWRITDIDRRLFVELYRRWQARIDWTMAVEALPDFDYRNELSVLHLSERPDLSLEDFKLGLYNEIISEKESE